MQQHGPPELVPVQLTLGSSKGTLQDWLLWPVGSADEDLADFSEGLVRDLGVPLQFRRPVADAVRAQVADWVASVPPATAATGARRELVRLDLVLGGSLRLRDQFWWDLHATSPTPEEFAAELCGDLGVDACHGSAVAAAIRIELGKLRRAVPANLPLPTPRLYDSALAAEAAAAASVAAHDVGGADVFDDMPIDIHASRCLRDPGQWQEWGPSLHRLNSEEARALQKQQHVMQRRRHQQHQQQQVELEHDAQRQQQQDLLRQQQQQAQQHEQQQAQQAAQRQQEQQQAQQAAQQQQQAQQAAQQQQQQQTRQERVGNDEAVANGRRQLRPRCASRLAELLRQEEESDSSSSGGSGSEGGSKNASQAAAAAAAPANGGGGGWAAAAAAIRQNAEAGAAAGVGAGPGGYQPGEGLLAQDMLVDGGQAEEVATAAPAGANTNRQQPRSRQQQQRRRGGRPAAAAAAAAQPQLQPVMPAQHTMLLPTPQPQAMLTSAGQLPGSAAMGATALLLGMGGSPADMMVNGSGTLPVMVPQQQPMPQQQQQAALLQHQQQQAAALQQHQQHQAAALQQQHAAAAAATAGAGTPPAAASAPATAQQQQHAQVVGAAIVHYARELNIGEHKIQSFLTRTPSEQLTLFRTLHQLVQQARAKQQEQLEAAVLAQQAQQATAALHSMPMQHSVASLPPLQPLQVQAAVQQQQAAAQQQQQVVQQQAAAAAAAAPMNPYANLFSEMFD